ncbi:hypothetical protein P154DRAFT_259037 [Amniculicola lignicola CBS 123094]|uniref:Uncharacterized protein n=1 Tax=Amniculicola lignicola CBS 123094 TaxID=1392246 RepID=A0A6A5X019_9PLEO|nr:hypothetical protein P154DRAFT_259037 [Amniculicola lignicola CBS 123094]
MSQNVGRVFAAPARPSVICNSTEATSSSLPLGNNDIIGSNSCDRGAHLRPLPSNTTHHSTHPAARRLFAGCPSHNQTSSQRRWSRVQASDGAGFVPGNFGDNGGRSLLRWELGQGSRNSGLSTELHGRRMDGMISLMILLYDIRRWSVEKGDCGLRAIGTKGPLARESLRWT